jgi:hypothetical protein
VKKRRLAGVDTLILRGSEHGTFSMAREWTNWADPDPRAALNMALPRLDADLLLELVDLLEQLGSRSSRKLPESDPKEIDK